VVIENLYKKACSLHYSLSSCRLLFRFAVGVLLLSFAEDL